MSPYQPWQPGGVRVRLGDLTFDSTISCGNGHDFREVGEGHIRFRARVGRENYAWRYYFRIGSPGDGREVLLEVADLNHFGQELWQEQATVISTDGVTWADVGLDRMAIVPHTPTGVPELDDTADDGWHPPYGVQMRLRLDSPALYLATPTPYTPAHSRDHLHALERRCNFFHVEEIGRSRHHDSHGFPLLMCRVTKGGDASERLRVFVVAGEHPSESAGMYAAEGLLEEILRTHDLLADFDFWVVPIVNVDGVVFGKSYYDVAPDPADVGVNLARDWTDRTQPETQAVWRGLEQVQPHCVLSLHNGRHRREYEAWAPPHPGLATMMDALREHLPVPLQHWRPDTPGMLTHEVSRVAASPGDALPLCFETLLLRKLPGCSTFTESYRRTGMALARGLVAGLRDLHGRPRMLAQREPLATTPLRLKAADFVAQLPSLYYDRDCTQLRDHSRRSFEANGLPLPPGRYDVHLRMQPDQTLRLSEEPSAPAYFSAPGWRVLPSFPLPARLLSFDFDADGEDLPFTEVVITPEGLPLETALDAAVPYDRYVRDTLADTRPHFRDWAPFYARLRQGGFGADDLQAMHDEIVDWAAGRQVLDEGDPHYGAVYSEEDKYDGRDAAAAAACFTRRWRLTGDDEWRQRALLARAYTYRLQRHEPGNPAHDGGFLHMVHGMWGVNFTRLEPPWPGIDGVDTSLVVHQLCRAADLGLPLADGDREVLTQAAQWLLHSEALPGVFLHHEGATHDCQNATALGLSALVRITHTLAQPGRGISSGRGVAAGDGDPAAWLGAAARGLDHYLSGQEAIGVWPYHFAMVGRRAGQYHFSNIPDHGIGLSHLTRVAHLPPLCDHPGLLPALRRAACWYLGVSGLDGDTINLDYDRRPDLGDDICFAGFTWCRFTAAATLLRIARLTGETEPWRNLALRLMEHVRRHLWQRDDPSHAPVVAHARPEAKLATWCQAAEWNASMLSEMIEDLQQR